MYIFNELPLENGLRAGAIPPILKLCVTLELLSSGSYQTLIGHDFYLSMAQNTVSKIVSELFDMMEDALCSNWIQFLPNNRTREHFFEHFGMPGVVGCVDGTHVYLLRPWGEDEHMYLNRKQKHSLNVMVVS